jgi:hypothetical protein
MNKERRFRTSPVVGRSTSLDQGKAAVLIQAAAVCALAASVALFVLGQREPGIFVSLWLPSIVFFGHLVMEGTRHE